MNKTKINSEEVYETLVSSSKVVGTLDVDCRIFRPCIAKMIENGLEQGGYPDRATGSLIIACELRRLGKDQDYVLNFLTNWNQKNRPPRRYSEIKHTVNSAYGKEYPYSCGNSNLQALCIGEEFCSYSKLISPGGKYTINRKFLEFGWQNILSNAAKDLYYIALPELERRLGVGAGGTIIANHKRYAHFAGITPKSVGKGLIELSTTSLIKDFEMGKPRKWEGKATKLRRAIPIPRPSKELLLKREKVP